MDRNTVSKLTEWYRLNKRELPWRDTGDPYDVWLSEIMLQQTRIPVVAGRFAQFKKELPDIPALASASLDQVNKLWEGLGYYSRAASLHKCAKVLCEKYNGMLPETYEELLDLPGIGEYTAAAIASIAFEKPCAAVDGNVIRVITRLKGIRENARDPKVIKRIKEELKELSECAQTPSEFTAGWMELGEVICLPAGKPRCEACPLRQECTAYREGLADQIPLLEKKAEKKNEEWTVLLIRDEDSVLVEKRAEKGLLAGLYGFPMVKGHWEQNRVFEMMKTEGYDILSVEALPEAKHVFTHRVWDMKVYEVRVKSLEGKGTKIRDLSSLSIPSAFQSMKKYFGL